MHYAHARLLRACGLGSEVSRGGFFQSGIVQSLIGYKFLRSNIRFFELFHRFGLFGTQATILRSPTAVSLLGNAQLLAGSWSLQTLEKRHLRFADLAEDLFCCISLAWHRMLSFITSKTLILYQCMDSVKGARSRPLWNILTHLAKTILISQVTHPKNLAIFLLP